MRLSPFEFVSSAAKSRAFPIAVWFFRVLCDVGDTFNSSNCSLVGPSGLAECVGLYVEYFGVEVGNSGVGVYEMLVDSGVTVPA